MASSSVRGGLGWILGKISLLRVVKHCNRLSREVLKSQSLEVLKKCVHMALQDMV